MKNQESISNKKKLQVFSIIMMVSGVIIWLMSDSEKEIIHDLIKGLGVFLFILGIIGISDISKRLRK